MAHKNVYILNYDMSCNGSSKASDVDGRIQVNDPEEYNSIIKKSNNWKITNALSEIRSNCIEWIPFKKTDRVLEIGCGYGEISEMLSHKIEKLDCIEVRLQMCNITAKRTEISNCSTSVYLGTIEEFLETIDEKVKYDYIVMVGSFSHINDYLRDDIDCDAQREALKILAPILKKDGHIVIADDNKLGLKFWNGAKNDVNNKYFGTLENTNDDSYNLLSKNEYIDLCKNIGFDHIKFFYPYPDYKYSMSIYSDEYLPKIGDLNVDMYNWEKAYLNLFSEPKVFNSLIKEKLFDRFCNSFVVILGNGELLNWNKIFIKYSNERSKPYKIKTEIAINDNGKKFVYKIPLNNFAENHLKKMPAFFDEFSSRNRGSIKLNKCCQLGSGLQCEYLEGVSLADKLTDLTEKKEYSGVKKLVEKFFENIQESNITYFVPSNKFKMVFGNVDLPNDMLAASYGNIDLIFQNVIETDDGTWNIIDYEWTFDFPIPFLYVAFRSIFYFQKLAAKSDHNGNDDLKQELYHEFGITEELQQTFWTMEFNLQKYICNGNIRIRDLKKEENNINIIYHPVEFFLDSGHGFLKEKMRKNDSTIILGKKSHITVNFNYNEAKRIRIDPYSKKCIIKILSLTNGYGVNIPFKTNGSQYKGNIYVFKHNDPQIICENLKNVIDKIYADVIIYEIDDEIMAGL